MVCDSAAARCNRYCAQLSVTRRENLRRDTRHRSGTRADMPPEPRLRRHARCGLTNAPGCTRRPCGEPRKLRTTPACYAPGPGPALASLDHAHQEDSMGCDFIPEAVSWGRLFNQIVQSAADW